MIARICLTAALLAAASATPGFAEQQTLKFRLVTKELTSTVHEVENVPGRSVSLATYAGFAVFEDGRIAYKDFMDTSDGSGEDGTFVGYSTYSFENGDALTAKYTGSWSAEGLVGEYEVLSGEGAYAGATGTGRFEAVDSPWDKANLLEGEFTLEVRGI